MTAAGLALAQRLATVLADTGEHARQHPAEADELVATLVSHVRNWRPETMPCDLEPPDLDQPIACASGR